jgi:hypothetical protein
MNDSEIEAVAERAAQRITGMIVAVGIGLGVVLVLGFTHRLGPALEAASWLFTGMGVVVAVAALLALGFLVLASPFAALGFGIEAMQRKVGRKYHWLAAIAVLATGIALALAGDAIRPWLAWPCIIVAWAGGVWLFRSINGTLPPTEPK